MTKIAVISDSHWDINSRWDETLRVHQWFANDIKERGVDLVLHAGDFGPLIPIRAFKPVETLAVCDFLQSVTEWCPFYGVAGNHDVHLQMEVLNKAKSKHFLRITERPERQVVTAKNGQKMAVAGMPWPIKAQLMARTSGLSNEVRADLATDSLRSIFLDFGIKLRETQMHMPSVLLMHAMVTKSTVSIGQPIAPGQDFMIGQEDIGLAGADYSALGHVHLGIGNEWKWNGKDIAYVGSPRRTNFGEREEKTYTLIEFDGKPAVDGGWAYTWQRVPIPCAPMLAFDCEWKPEIGFTYGDQPFPFQPDCAAEKGAELRFRYQVSSDQREVAKIAAKTVKQELLEHGCVNVQVEEQIIQVTHARAPEIVETLNIKDQLQILWRTQSDIPSADQQARLFEKLSTLELEAQSQ